MSNPLRRRLAVVFGGFLWTGCALAPRINSPIPPLSTTHVHRLDVVEAHGKQRVLGTIENANRDDDVVRYFRTPANRRTYSDTPTMYPDIEPGQRVAAICDDLDGMCIPVHFDMRQ